MALTITDVESDLASTDRDIERLDSIAAGIRTFMNDSQGEDRSAFKVDVIKYEGLAGHARRLRENIVKVKDALQNKKGQP